jgi:hypothetical protein
MPQYDLDAGSLVRPWWQRALFHSLLDELCLGVFNNNLRAIINLGIGTRQRLHKLTLVYQR